MIALWIVQKLVGLAMGFFGGGAGSLGGKTSAGMGSISGGLKGFLEEGGTAERGKAYVVGERRPEVFVPGATGYVYPSMQDFAKTLMPREMGGQMKVPAGMTGSRGAAGATTNEFLIANLLDPKMLARLMKSKPLKDAILNVVTDNPSTIRRAGIGG
jgi:hypothetical protein